MAEAFVVENCMFLFAGSSKEAMAMAVEGDSFVDLKGRFVCSGFNDSHMHLLGYGSMLNTAQLADRTNSLADMLNALREFQSSHPYTKDGWIQGRGWNQDYFSDTDRMPNRFDLDQVSAENPVCVIRSCGHCLVVNTRALEILGVTTKTHQPEGGRIGIENGILDGRFFDNAMDLVYKAIPTPEKEELKQMILAGCRALNSYGITSCQSDDYCVFRKVPWKEINEAYQELEEAGELTVRVYEQSNFTDLSELKEFVEAGNRTGAGTDLFRIGPLKLLGDGALGARTAYLSREYADCPSTCGIPVFSQETLDEMVSYANSHRMQTAVHAIGDACLDRVLKAYEKALLDFPKKDHRHGIVHCQITRPEQLKKICELNLHVYAQTIFLDYDIQIVEKRVGKELAFSSYRWKSLMKGGACVSNGTDCPVETPNPLASMQCAVTRTTLHGQIGPYLPEEQFSVQEALDSYTICGAKASFEEDKKGRIQKGMMADFVVLGQNPFTVEPDKIKDIPVCATYLAGRKVFENAVDFS